MHTLCILYFSCICFTLAGPCSLCDDIFLDICSLGAALLFLISVSYVRLAIDTEQPAAGNFSGDTRLSLCILGKFYSV